MKITKQRLKKIVREEIQNLNEGLKRFKVYVSGEKEPLILMGKDEKDVKKTAHMMIRNSSVKIRKVVKEGEDKGDKYEVDKEGKMAKYDVKEIEEDAEDIFDMIEETDDLPEWLEAKITIAAHNMNVVKDYLTHHHSGKNEGMTEAGRLGGPITMGKDITSNYTAPKRDTSGGPSTFLQKFSSNEAKKIIDGQLINMAKELRKVQYKVIKTWMDGAKSGVIDFFDIIRGLKTGDVSRAQPYEVDFLVDVLTRDKIINRFRSYFDGKKGKPRK